MLSGETTFILARDLNERRCRHYTKRLIYIVLLEMMPGHARVPHTFSLSLSLSSASPHSILLHEREEEVNLKRGVVREIRRVHRIAYVVPPVQRAERSGAELLRVPVVMAKIIIKTNHKIEVNTVQGSVKDTKIYTYANSCGPTSARAAATAPPPALRSASATQGPFESSFTMSTYTGDTPL